MALFSGKIYKLAQVLHDRRHDGRDEFQLCFNPTPLPLPQTGNAHLNGSLFKGGASLRYGGRFMDILTNPDLKSSFHHHHHHHKYHHHYHDWT